MLTPLQQKRRDAALKAAATKKRNAAAARAAGTAYAPPPPQSPPRRPSPPNNNPVGIHCTRCGVVYPVGTYHQCRTTVPPPSNPWAAPAPPRPTQAPSNGGGLWSTPKPTIESQRAIVLASLTDLFALVAADAKQKNGGKTPDALSEAFDRYQKMLTRALAPSTDSAMKNEADTALRVAAMNLVKLTF